MGDFVGIKQPRGSRLRPIVIGAVVGVMAVACIAFVAWRSLRTTFHRGDLVELNRMKVTVPTGLLYWSDSMDTHCGIDCAGATTHNVYLVPCEGLDGAIADLERDLVARGFPPVVQTFNEGRGRGNWLTGPLASPVSTRKVWVSFGASQAHGPVNAASVTDEQLAQGCNIWIRMSVENPH